MKKMIELLEDIKGDVYSIEQSKELRQVVLDKINVALAELQSPKDEPIFMVHDSIVQPIIGLRDYYAGQAVAGIVNRSDSNFWDKTNCRLLANAAYMIADAMLEARKGKGEKND
jgi:hypothetical protein